MSGRSAPICSTVAVPTAALVTPDPAAEEVQLDVLAVLQDAGDRHRVRDHGDGRSGRGGLPPGEFRGDGGAGGARVEADRPGERRRHETHGGPGDRGLAEPCCPSRSATLSSTTLDRPTGTAPPCTRRRTPADSRASRSRRTVSVVTSKCSASSATDTRPADSSEAAMASCRSVAYMPELLRSRGFRALYAGKSHDRNCFAAEPTRPQTNAPPCTRQDGVFGHEHRCRLPLDGPRGHPADEPPLHDEEEHHHRDREQHDAAAISPPKSVPLFVENPASHTGSVYIPWSFSITYAVR